ncbi:MAG: glycosyltransferase, partial [Nanoarchaeota archaeon]|nr:glycosyltransferase [Nanoarchaeota archaeon]
SIIITGYKEPKTIGRSIESFQKQEIKEKYEIIVIAPDKETLNVAKKYKNIKIYRDIGKGKPTALNLAFKKAKGDILVLTDGDVYVSDNSINELLENFKDNIGAVSGHPVSLNDKNTFLGYVSHLLTFMADKIRKKLISKNKFIVCTGYLYAIKKDIVKEIPENILSDDAYISRFIANKNYKIEYAENALVYVKYPDNLNDWIKQKRRSTGGYEQLKKYFDEKSMRSFTQEASGIFSIFLYPKNLKELYWTKKLVFLRLYLWFLIFYDTYIKKKKFEETWVRIESTK